MGMAIPVATSGEASGQGIMIMKSIACEDLLDGCQGQFWRQLQVSVTE